MLLQIRPGLARAWRAPGRLQIGLDPRCGVVLDGLTAADEHVLAVLDAGTDDLGRLHARSRRWGLAADRVDDLVRLLGQAGVLLPGTVREPVGRPSPSRALARLTEPARTRLLPTAHRLAVAYPDTDGWEPLARRLAARVLVQGGCRVGLRVALTLAAAGAGAVDLVDDSPVSPGDLGPGAYRTGDLGRPRARAAAELLEPVIALVTATTPTTPTTPTAVVLVGSGALDPSRYDPWLACDVAHLAVLVRESDAVVGPFVRAGRGCCLRCVELYRADRDPEWPRVAAQVATGWDARCDPALAEHVAALAVSEVLTLLDGREQPVSLGRTLEIAPGRPVPVLRGWPAHPRCGCLALPVPPIPLRPGVFTDHLGAPAEDLPSTMGG